MVLLIRWGWVLGIALLAPAAMPAGGGELRIQDEILLSRHQLEPLLSGEKCKLKSSPSPVAPSIRVLNTGTPMKLIRAWRAEDGKHWLQVQVSGLGIGIPSNFSTRGWIIG